MTQTTAPARAGGGRHRSAEADRVVRDAERLASRPAWCAAYRMRVLQKVLLRRLRFPIPPRSREGRVLALVVLEETRHDARMAELIVTAPGKLARGDRGPETLAGVGNALRIAGIPNVRALLEAHPDALRRRPLNLSAVCADYFVEGLRTLRRAVAGVLGSPGVDALDPLQRHRLDAVVSEEVARYGAVDARARVWAPSEEMEAAVRSVSEPAWSLADPETEPVALVTPHGTVATGEAELFLPADFDEGDDGEGEVEDLGRCCACRQTGPTVRNILLLDHRAPVPGTGWGCVVCHLPNDGALAVRCDACQEADRPILEVVNGLPADRDRVPFARVERTVFGHDPAHHPKMQEEEA